MQIPLEVRFHNIDRSEAVEAAAREHAAKLERFASDVVSCRVTVEAPHKHHRHGNLYHVTVDVHMPGGEAVASRSPSTNQSHADVYVALRDAFKAAQRQVEDYVRVRRGDIKRHGD